MIYIVLGMHKSGTTLVSQMLHRSGVDMGDGFEEQGSYDEGNQWERREAFLINLDLCGCGEDRYFSLDHHHELRGELPEAQERAMRRMVKRCEAAGEDWGFKEPLTCLTYPLWKRVLPPHRIVGVYRSPIEVINHYRVPSHGAGKAWRVLRAWSNYNRGMMRAVCDDAFDSLIIRYEDLMRGDTDYLRLQDFLGRALVDVRNPGQYRAGSGNPLFQPLDCLMAASSLGRPSKIFRELEAVRAEDLSPHSCPPVQAQGS